MQQQPAKPEARRFVVAVGESPHMAEAVRACGQMADAARSSWHAVHVETPAAHRRGSRERAAEALALAARLGATVATIPAANLADGLVWQLEEQGATDLLLGQSRALNHNPFRRSLSDQIAARCRGVTLHLLPRLGETPHSVPHPAAEPQPGAATYGLALVLVAVTTLIAAPAAYLFGPRGLDLFFLFPVITASVRFGLRQGVVAALASVFCYNLLFVRPAFTLSLGSAQALFMTLGLCALAIYTGMISEQLRGRLRLSDRSAQENAAIVTFAQELARAGNWDETARIVCQTLAAMLDVRTVVLREKGGELAVVAGEPVIPVLGPVDEIARDWAWQQGQEAGRGTQEMAAADWQFVPLKTGLGLLALIGLARDNGEAPVPADKAVLLATLTSLAALAHERLRLEDLAIERAGESA